MVDLNTKDDETKQLSKENCDLSSITASLKENLEVIEEQAKKVRDEKIQGLWHWCSAG